MDHHIAIRRGSVALLATLSLALGATSAVAQEGHGHKDHDTGERVLTARESAAVDARQVARQHDWKTEPTLVFLEESRKFAELTSELEETHPEAYAAAVYAEDPGDPSVVRFVGTPPKEALDRIKESGLRVEVDDGARRSAKELRARTDAVHARLLESGYDQVVAAALPDGTIEASVFGKGSPELPRALSHGVRVTESDKPVAHDAHTRGGARLLDDGVFECTSGFSVRGFNGATGVATAGHCNGLNQYQQPSDLLTYSMTHQAEHYGFWGDAEWKTTTHIEPAEYYARSAEVREVNSVSNLLPVNTPTCKYGRASNVRTCDDVYSNYVVAAFAGPTHYFLMATDNNNVTFGDSGGPWSFSTEADGITKGFMTLGGSTRDVWMRASLFPIAISVNVITQ